MSSELECVQQLRERFKSLHSAEVVANWSSSSRERSHIAQRLHQDADALREMLRETNAHLNTLVPIGRLPPEILGTTFAMVAEAELPSYASETKIGTLGWVRLSHVCKAWRDLCIGTPALWGRAIGRLPRALPIFVERAGEHVPLDFCLLPGWDEGCRPHGRRDTQFSAADVLRKESKRLESLQLCDGSIIDTISIQVTLATLAFDVLRYLRIESTAPPRIHTIIPPLRAGALETIHFQSFFMPFVAPRLTTLSLHGINNRLDIPALRSIIQGCPFLESIWMSKMKHLNFEELAALPVLPLPRLGRLHLDLDIAARDINTFINSLAVPSTAQLIIHRAKMIVFSDFLLFETVFRVTEIPNEEIDLSFVANTVSLEAVYRNGHPRRLKAELMISNLSELSHTLDAMRSMLQPYLKQVTHLAMRSPPFCMPGTWERIFHLLNKVETIDITADSPPRAINATPVKAVFEALGECFDEYDMPLPSLPLPKLAHIKLTLNVSIPLGQALTRQDLYACLQTRVFAEAHSVHTLYLDGPADIAAQNLLCKLVQRLLWKVR